MICEIRIEDRGKCSVTGQVLVGQTLTSLQSGDRASILPFGFVDVAADLVNSVRLCEFFVRYACSGM